MATILFDHCVTLAIESCDRLIAWLDSGACVDDRAAEFVNGQRALNERLKLMREPFAPIERREPPRRKTNKEIG